VPVVWDAGDEPPALLTATAETTAAAPAVTHYHLHLPPGTDLSGLALALPAGSVVTTEEE
jgi:hypothetical protein